MTIVANVTYQLSTLYAAGIRGATVRYGPQAATFDILAALVAGGGDAKGVGGQFTVNDSDLITVLDKHPSVDRTGLPGPAPAPAAPVFRSVVAAYGTLSKMPPAGSVQEDSRYYATDDRGGTEYRSQNGAWVIVNEGRYPTALPPYSQITKPFITSHRGSSQVFPEEALAAYDSCMNLPLVNTLEGDVNLLSDGTLIMLHDTTLDRTTTMTGGLGQLTLPQWRALLVDDQDASVAAWQEPRPATVEDLFRRFGKRAYYNLGPKNGDASNTAMLAMIRKYGLSDYVLWGPSAQSGYNFWKNTGVPMFWGYANGQDIPTMQQGKADGVLCTGFPSINATDFANAHTAGLLVAAALDYRAVAAPALVAGADGITTGDAMWMSGLNPVAVSDPYAFKRYWYGCWPFGSTNRGKFLGTNRWGIDDASSTWVLQGWGSPVPKSIGPVWDYPSGTFTNRAATYPWTITFTQQLDRAAPASGNSEAGCAFGCTDDGSVWNFGGKGAGSGSGAAYYATINEDGTLNVYKRVNATVSLLQTTATPALTVGQSATIKITMTSASAFSVQRTDGTPSTILTVNDGTLRGGYFRLGHNIDSGWSWSAVALG